MQRKTEIASKEAFLHLYNEKYLYFLHMPLNFPQLQRAL